MKPQAIVTIVSNNYLHYARTLMQSVALHHPDAQRYCVIVDADPAPAAALAEEFEAIALTQLGLPFGDEFLFQYTILELNTAVKPWALEYLLNLGHAEVFYIDPDIFLYRPLKEVEQCLTDGASIVLTPHLLAPVTDQHDPDELAIRIAGSYNLGFCALSNQPTTHQFLRWWQSKLERNCVVDFASGIFVDQSWMDLVPGMFDQVAILRHPGYNIAYWNLAQREVQAQPESWTVNGQALAFFHFSGIDPQAPQKLSKHQNRFTLDTVSPAVKQLVLGYCATVMANGLQTFRSLPYGYAKFENGVAISSQMRSNFRTTPSLRRLVDGRPFHSAQHFNATANMVGAETSANSSSASANASDALASARLRGLYQYFLGRNPDPSALSKSRKACATLPGTVRAALSIGRSAESRRNPLWMRRLLIWPIWQMLLALQPDLSSSVTAESAPLPANGPADTPGASLAAAKVGQVLPVPGINLVGYIAAELGIGEATRSLARACGAVDVPYSVVDVGYQSSNLQRDTHALLRASKDRFSIDLVYVNPDQTPDTLHHLKKIGLESAYKIGFWHWEQPQLPAAHLPSFAYLNEVWVPSKFVYDAVAAVSPVPVFIIPHALEVRATPGVQRRSLGLPEDGILALVMYDFHSYQYRKNPQAAIAAFRLAVQGRTDAVLVVKTINGHHHPEALAELRAHLDDLPGTVMLEQFLTRQETWDLQSCCDMLISLHRAEGFGLAPAEMMALGKPVVATGWSANMDFMNADNSMPVHYQLRPLAEDIGAYRAGPVWAEADIKHAAVCIRALLDSPALRERLGRQAAVDIARQLSPETVGALVRGRLAALAHWHPELLSSYSMPPTTPPTAAL